MSPTRMSGLVLYRRLARAQNEGDLGEIRDGRMRDRFGPVPTLIENLIAAMNVRRQMKQLMILSAILKGSQLEIRFHPDAPVETARLVKLADQNRRTMRLTPSYQVIARIEPAITCNCSRNSTPSCRRWRAVKSWTMAGRESRAGRQLD